ncbi:MAG: tRNA (adenosine(37)-N6)-threonylcarbamoyltransferase complex dimerization subunit type 1 TsaB [Rickettsiales bacterium]|jgi:tRNA threonylcarbamoyl adenosine modification protein YeaZ|nr:tRNA (adenosine(37)-N6)-threonylcarbamoyltransferase complex dimerization subunit type 1 TsaB [Rickettsiales bacterium]
MKILTIDTTTDKTWVILQDNKAVIRERLVDAGNRHAELLLPTIEEILRAGNLSYDSVDCLSLTNGPGSFIGLKVSMAFAKALRCTRPGIRIILNSTFQILSFQQSYDFVVLDAGNGGLYLSDREERSFYSRKEECHNFLNINSRIITNSLDAIDFLKSSDIVHRQVSSQGVTALNHFKYVNERFSEGKMEPIYIREPQVNIRNEQKLYNK